MEDSKALEKLLLPLLGNTVQRVLGCATQKFKGDVGLEKVAGKRMIARVMVGSRTRCIILRNLGSPNDKITRGSLLSSGMASHKSSKV